MNLLNRLRQWKASQAARVMSETRVANERERIHSKARQMRQELGLPDHPGLA